MSKIYSGGAVSFHLFSCFCAEASFLLLFFSAVSRCTTSCIRGKRNPVNIASTPKEICSQCVVRLTAPLLPGTIQSDLICNRHLRLPQRNPSRQNSTVGILECQ